MSDSFQADMTEMLILHVLSPGATYGFDIVVQVLERSHGQLAFKEGDLYPVLHAMERQGMLHSYWMQLDDARRRKYYRVTTEGAKLLEARRGQWNDYAVGVDGVLGTPHWCDCIA